MSPPSPYCPKVRIYSRAVRYVRSTGTGEAVAYLLSQTIVSTVGALPAFLDE